MEWRKLIAANIPPRRYGSSRMNNSSWSSPTFVLVYAVLMFVDPKVTLPSISQTGIAPAGSVPAEIKRDEIPVGLGTIGAVRVGLVVFAIGLCLGGTTGYAINPASDLAPRPAPIPGKRDSDWSYSWIPALAPLLGGLLAALLAGIR